MLFVITGEWAVRRRQGRRGRLRTDDDGEHSRQGEQVSDGDCCDGSNLVPVGDAAQDVQEALEGAPAAPRVDRVRVLSVVSIGHWPWSAKIRVRNQTAQQWPVTDKLAANLLTELNRLCGAGGEGRRGRVSGEERGGVGGEG